MQPALGEERIRSIVPEEVVSELSAQKAGEVYGTLQKEAGDEELLVIGADTIVALDGKILGKPKDQKDAKRMLSELCGRSHQVYTGVTCCYSGKGAQRIITFTECTEVEIVPMTEEEIDSYVATGEPMDKAGAYAVQGKFAVYVRRLVGDYYNVMGLPVSKLHQELKRNGIFIINE